MTTADVYRLSLHLLVFCLVKLLPVLASPLVKLLLTIP